MCQTDLLIALPYLPRPALNRMGHRQPAGVAYAAVMTPEHRGPVVMLTLDPAYAHQLDGPS